MEEEDGGMSAIPVEGPATVKGITSAEGPTAVKGITSAEGSAAESVTTTAGSLDWPTEVVALPFNFGLSTPCRW